MFAFHDSLLAAVHVRQTAGTLSVLLFGGGAAAGLVSLVAHATFRRTRNNSPALGVLSGRHIRGLRGCWRETTG